jgi:isocitrate/isopropylmalate dehydrogenase
VNDEKFDEPAANERAFHRSTFFSEQAESKSTINQIRSGTMMLEHLGHAEADKAIIDAFEAVLEEADPNILTPDIRGNGSTSTLGEADRKAH